MSEAVPSCRQIVISQVTKVSKRKIQSEFSQSRVNGQVASLAWVMPPLNLVSRSQVICDSRDSRDVT